MKMLIGNKVDLEEHERVVTKNVDLVLESTIAPDTKDVIEPRTLTLATSSDLTTPNLLPTIRDNEPTFRGNKILS